MVALLSRRGDVGTRNQAEYLDRSDPRVYLQGLFGGSTSTERQPAIVAVSLLAEFRKLRVIKSLRSGDKDRMGRFPLGIGDSYLCTFGTGKPVDQTALHDGR